MINFNFKFYGNIYFGKGARFELKNILENENYQNLAVVIDHNLLDIPLFDEFISDLSNANKLHVIKCDISEPTYDTLEDKRISSANKKIDVFIGIGGGSALDLAKGLAVLYTNHGEALEYRGFDKYSLPIAPVIAIPTTAGTGSEITPNASFVDAKAKKKMGINGEAIRPKYAILDPELTLTCPESATISAGIDSMVHATEAFAAKKSNTMARLFAHEGYNLVCENLPLVIKNRKNIEARENVMYGAFLSAIALMNSGTGPAAALSYPLGVHYKVPHGIGGGIFLPYVVEHNVKNGFYEYGHFVTNHANQMYDLKSKAESFLRKMKETWEELNVSNDLSDFGINSNDIELIVSDTMELKGALDQNPLSFYQDEIKYVLNQLIKD